MRVGALEAGRSLEQPDIPYSRHPVTPLGDQRRGVASYEPWRTQAGGQQQSAPGENEQQLRTSMQHGRMFFQNVRQLILG